MTASEVLRLIRAAGGDVVLVDGAPRLRSPAPLPDDLVELAREHKPAILRELRGDTAAGEPWPAGIPRWAPTPGCSCPMCDPGAHGFRSQLEAARAAFPELFDNRA